MQSYALIACFFRNKIPVLGERHDTAAEIPPDRSVHCLAEVLPRAVQFYPVQRFRRWHLSEIPERREVDGCLGRLA